MIPIQNFAASALAELVRRQPASKERTSFAWQLAVGPTLARVTTVELDAQGVLTARSRDGRWLKEIERARPVVLGKLQQLLGEKQVVALRTEGS